MYRSFQEYKKGIPWVFPFNLMMTPIYIVYRVFKKVGRRECILAFCSFIKILLFKIRTLFIKHPLYNFSGHRNLDMFILDPALYIILVILYILQYIFIILE